jgi:Cu2+-containing amine oxidase
MDQIPKDTNETTVNTNFINYVTKFVGDRGINLNLNINENELPLIAKKLNDEKTRFDSFKNYLTFYCDNSQENDNTSFYEYILEKMNKDFGLNLETNDVEEYEKSDEDKKSLNNDDENMYNDIKEIVGKNETFIRFMNKRHFNRLNKLFIKNKKNGIYKRSECKLEKMVKQKMKYVIDDFLAFDKYQGMINSLTASFQIDLKFKSPSVIQKKLVEMKKKRKYNNRSY